MKTQLSHSALGYCMVAALLLAALALAGCNRDSAAKAAEAAKPDPKLFSVPADQMARVQVVTVRPTTLRRTLRLPGSVAYNSFQTTPVITQVGGPVSRVMVAPGQHVSAGEVMLYVSSPDYAQSRSNYLKAKSAFELADKNYQRARDLYAHQAIAERDLQQAETDRSQAEDDLQAARQALAVLGIHNEEQLLKTGMLPEIPVLAPITGEVVDRLCAAGQVIQAGSTQCFTISNMETVWVLVNVYEHDLAYVRPGDQAAITTDAYPTIFHGRISYVGAALDPNTRTLQARIVTENPREMLKNNMYVTALVDAGTIPDAIAVPDAAVLRDAENLPFVYVKTGTNQYAQRLVHVAESNNGLTQIVSGLTPGDQVIADGSLFLQFQNSLQQ